MKNLLLLLMLSLAVLTNSYAVKPHAKNLKKNNIALNVANPNAAGSYSDIKKPSFIQRVKVTVAKIAKKLNPADDGKVYAILAHLWLVGWLIVFVLNMDKKNEFVSFYLRQLLGIIILSLLSIIPIVGWIWGIFVFVLWIISLIGALSGEQKLVPIFGKMFQNWFKNI